MGLRPEHHGELNRGASPERIAELRTLYAHDPVALQQIDVYDPGATEYHDLMRDYIDGIKTRNSAKERWSGNELRRRWPDV